MNLNILMIDALLLLLMVVRLVGYGNSLFLRLPETLEVVNPDVAVKSRCGSHF